jgi:DNA-binding NtrC family response regulator
MGVPDVGVGGRRVLVADDDEAVLLTLAAIVEGIDGVEVTRASTFADAMEALGTGELAVIVTELNIDGPGDGLELLRAALERQPSASGIVLTASASLQSAIAAMKLGVTSYLVKPCNIDELKLAIQLALQRTAGERDAARLQAALLAQHEAERSLETAKQRVASRIAGPLGSLRERIARLQQQADELDLADSVRFDIEQLELAATRVKATVDTLLEEDLAASSITGDLPKI